ncbi:acyl carrier protein [Noviherbaspirillum aerium]|uniref:acyl carrier protein n=1 Tax=Noviherbaspirillum aerium TaxID=2588497 RepID=UPI00124D0E8D|nr:acyl carrier protein [Noviherbaspirillum aerium]
MTNSSEQKNIILDIVARAAQRPADTLQPADSLTDLGIDSLAFIMMVLDVEQALGRPAFNMETVGQLRTVGDLLAPLGQ